DVEHVVEVAGGLEPGENGIGVWPRGVGQKQLLAPGGLRRRPPRRGVGGGGGVGLMNEKRGDIGGHAALWRSAAARRAQVLLVIFLQAECLLGSDLEIARDVVAYALVDLLPQVEVMGIKRVVEIENPRLHMTEGARRAAS